MADGWDALAAAGAGFSGNAVPYGELQVKIQQQEALKELGQKFSSGQINQQQYLQALAMTDPMAARRLAGVDTPSALQELAALQGMTPDQKSTYWQIKRAAPIVNLGGSQAVLSPQGTGAVTTQLPVTLKPEDQPENAAAKAGATAEASAKGAAVGAAEGATEKKIIQAPQVENLLSQAEKLLPAATSGGASNASKKAQEFFGYTAGGSEADTRLDVIGAALTAGVPRMEGPQSNYDVKLYEKAAGDLANPNKPIKVRQAAIKTMRELNNKYLNQNSGAEIPAASDSSQPKVRYNAKGQKATLVNGKWVVE